MSDTQPISTTAAGPANGVQVVPPAASGGVTQATMVKKAAPKTAYKPADVSPQRRVQRSYSVRLWAVRNSRALEWFYARFADIFLMLHPLWNRIGYGRVEAPVTFVEKRVKGFMFDCRMCGQCILSSTGMSCPMNCPKQLRNGPCGGVRANGNCEVEPDMPCVWVKAWEGSRTWFTATRSSMCRSRSTSRCVKHRRGCASPRRPRQHAKRRRRRCRHDGPPTR